MNYNELVDVPGSYRCRLVEVSESVEQNAPKFSLTWLVIDGPMAGRIIRDFLNYCEAGQRRAGAVMAKLRLNPTDLRTVAEMIGITADIEVEMRHVTSPTAGPPRRMPRVRFAGVKRVVV